MAAAERDPAALVVPNPTNKPLPEVTADLAWSAVVSNTMIMRKLLDRLFPNADLTSLARESRQLADKIKRGDMSHLEDTLASQSTVLQAAFAELMRRGASNLDQNPALGLEMMELGRMMQQGYVNTANALRKTTSRPKKVRGRARREPMAGD